MPLAPQAFEGHIFLLHCPTLIDVIVVDFVNVVIVIPHIGQHVHVPICIVDATKG
jgi:hypothetical protein